MAVLARTLVLLGVVVGATLAPISAESIPRNPRHLRVAQWLGESRDGVGAEARSRVRFEWDQVRGARAYLLRGRWTGDESWAVRSTEHRVTPGNATEWGARRVEFDVALPAGSHSWRVVALFGPNDTGDFENATRLVFDVR